MKKPVVAFICTHNSCRSQMAEAIGRCLAGDAFQSVSAGTELKSAINPDAVRLIKQRYGVDMTLTQKNKLVGDIPAPDIAVSMGCGVSCPFIGRGFDEDWGLEDPTGQPDSVFNAVIDKIEENILRLKGQLAAEL